MRAILFAGAGAIAGLCGINLATDFESLSPDIDLIVFWLESAVLVIYWLLLVIIYRRTRGE